MQNVADCPSARDIEDALLGFLPEGQIDSVQQHLLSCAKCLETAHSLHSSDAVVDSLLVDASLSTAIGHIDPHVQKVIEQLRDKGASLSRSGKRDGGRAPEQSWNALAIPQAVAEADRHATTHQTLGDYELLEKIGAGGMGQVFKAQHRHMDRIVAIKLLPTALTQDAAAVKRFQREVKAVAKLTHPNIVQAYDASVQRGVWYLVMEYVEGCDLSELVKQRGQLPVEVAINCILQAARGLAYAHSTGVIHRDIKPANILFAKNGVVKVLDMGLARIEGLDNDNLTRTEQVMGTIDFMPPEQSLSTHSVDARGDIYSLGCTLWYLLTAAKLYEGQTVLQRAMGHHNAPIPSLTRIRSDVSQSLERLFQKMVAKLPEDRIQEMSQVAAELESEQHILESEASVGANTSGSNMKSFFSQLKLQPLNKTHDMVATHLEQADMQTVAFGARGTSTPVPILEAIIPQLPFEEAAELSTFDRSNMPSVGTSARQDGRTDDAIPKALAVPPRPPRRSGRRILLGGLAFGLPLLLAAIYFWKTKDGVVRIESNDPAIQVAFDNDELKIVGAYKEPMTITQGQHGLRIKKGDNFEFQTNKLIVDRGEAIILKVELLEGEVRIVQAGKGLLDAKPLVKRAVSVDSGAKFLYALPWLDQQQHFSAHLYQTEISADGKLFLACGDTGPVGDIRIFEMATGKQVQTLVPGGEPWFNFAKFLPDNRSVVASYNKKKNLYHYDVITGKIVGEFAGHDADSPLFALSPDGTRILSWSDDKTLRLWDVASASEIRQFEGHTDKASGVFSPDGKQILTFSLDNTLRLWSVATGKELQKLVGHSKAPTGCFSPDGKRALSYSPDATIRLWDLDSGSQIGQFEGPKGPVHYAGFVADGRLVVGNNATTQSPSTLGPRDGKFRVWNANTRELLREIDCTRFGEDRGTITATPDGRQAVVNHEDGSVRVIDLVTGAETHIFENCRKARGFSFHGPQVVSGSFRSGIFVFRLESPSADGGWDLRPKQPNR
jgi:serine/threonine protein kinase/WD40 repeat protein